jgi:hypothetical protein
LQIWIYCTTKISWILILEFSTSGNPRFYYIDIKISIMTLNDYLDLISNDYKYNSPEEILEAYFQFTSNVIPFIYPTDFDIPGIAVYRGRLWGSGPPPTKIQECSYNPNINDYGRCHIPGHPVFYGSENPSIVPHEINARVGDIVVFSKWNLNITTEMATAFLVLGLKIYDPLINEFGMFINHTLENSYKSENNFGFTLEEFKHRIKVFNHLFLSMNYKLTGTIAHNLMYSNKIAPRPIEVVIYSSMTKYGSGLNYAIDKGICDSPRRRVYPIKFYLNRINDYKENKFSFNVLAVGKPVGDNIVWEDYSREKHEMEMLKEGIVK